MKTKRLLEIEGDGTPPDIVQYSPKNGDGEQVKPVRYIREDYAQLHDFDNFNKRFEYYLSKAQTYEEAYQMVESEHELAFGQKKYTGYDSFRQTRRRFIMRVRVTTFHLS